MIRTLVLGGIGLCLAGAAAVAADDPILEEPLFARHETVVALDEKTAVTVQEIVFPTFARQVKGTRLEVLTIFGWGWVERRQMLTLPETEKYCADHSKSPYALYLRSIVHLINDRQDQGLADLNAALKIDPKFIPALRGRGNVYAGRREFDKALADFTAAVKLAPQDLLAANDLAWFRATCPQAKYRDGKLAVSDATRVCEATGYQNEEFLDTLAAACAESGDFKSAVKWASKAAEIDPESDDFAAHVKLFAANKPLRDDGKPTPSAGNSGNTNLR